MVTINKASMSSDENVWNVHSDSKPLGSFDYVKILIFQTTSYTQLFHQQRDHRVQGQCYYHQVN